MLKTIDLFAGAGGLSYGFESTGEFLIVAAAENNKNARKTYIENHKGRNDIRLIPDVRDYDFSALASEFDGIDVVIGGPPCQGFSNANRQKNHIISMNNSLVKEYFRAVKEIRPKAFVMENVSMLSSETHRFYDSAKDHDVVTSLGVQMREDELVLADSDYNGYSLMNIIQADAVADYKISDELFQLLNVLYKNRNSEERLSKYIKNKSKLIIDKIASQAEEVKNNLGILNWIVDMINTEQISACFTELGQFIKFQKTFRLKEELDSNEIIYEIENDLQTGKIIACVKSYSVIEYVNKILGDDYKKNSGVINSLWFGVPQERRRFIMIGVRSDIIQEKEIEMPEGNGAEIVTVGQAIGDLRDYEVDEEDNEPEKLPYDSSTENLSDYARIMRKGSEGISNHIVPKSRDKAKARFAALKEGENFHNLDNGLKDNYAVPERTQNSIYLRLDSNRPSGTVINVRKSMWIHPTIDRAISVREAARLQSFPDRFVFKGTKDAQYPYPVIREYTDDYQSTEFIGELKVLLEPDGYAVHTNFEINNKGIQILLSKRILTYALEVQCVSTWFRKLYTIHENRVIRLDPQMIHERVELIPCIVAATSIEGFTNEDFAEEYQDMKFDLNAGDIIGIGQKRTFDALYQNDIIKNGSSIVDVGGNDKLKEIQCDFSQSTIKLTLPADQYENYRSCGYNRSKYKLLC